jgi:hypothetical protein
MYIHRSRKFQAKLLAILKYIAKEKVGASENFQIDSEEQINNIPNFPFKYKPSIYFNDKNVRDMSQRVFWRTNIHV